MKSGASNIAGSGNDAFDSRGAERGAGVKSGASNIAGSGTGAFDAGASAGVSGFRLGARRASRDVKREPADIASTIHPLSRT